jgi:hypothetical protein
LCDFKTLEHDSRGYVVRCEKCNYFQVAFGNIAIRINEERFSAFSSLISSMTDEKRNEVDKSARNIYFESPCRNILFLFSVKELDMLNDLLQSAMMNIQISRMLEA